MRKSIQGCGLISRWGTLLCVLGLSGCLPESKGVIASIARSSDQTNIPGPPAGTNPNPVPAPNPVPSVSFSGANVHRLSGNADGQIIVGSGGISNLKCGDVIAIQAGNYTGISFKGLQGCAGNPITISNEGGQVVIDGKNDPNSNWGIVLSQSSYVVVQPATSGTYGFKVMNNARPAMQIDLSSHDIDVSGIYALNMSYGVVSKTELLR